MRTLQQQTACVPDILQVFPVRHNFVVANSCGQAFVDYQLADTLPMDGVLHTYIRMYVHVHAFFVFLFVCVSECMHGLCMHICMYTCIFGIMF